MHITQCLNGKTHLVFIKFYLELLSQQNRETLVNFIEKFDSFEFRDIIISWLRFIRT